MKKISIFMALAAVALGFSSCSEDRDPVYHAPTQYVLNTPAMQDQYIELTEGNTLELSSSQPDYGYSAVAQYSAQMSLTSDFAQAYDLEAVDKTQARFQLKQEDIAVGICELAGITDEESYANYMAGLENGTTAVYFRAICQLAGVEGSQITSNVVSYNYVKPYFAVKMPGYIYLVGAPEGWAGPTESNAAHYSDWRLFEPDDAIGSKIYTGVFDVPAGSAMFRFYTALTGWDADSWGSQADDNPIQFPDFTSGSFTNALVKGKGAFEFPNWPGGKMTIVVDMSDENNATITIYEGEQSVVATKYIYLVGSISGWMAPGTENEEAYKAYRLADTTGEGIYVGSFAAAAGHVNFRFAEQLTPEGWDNPTQMGIQTDDGDVACTFSNGLYSGTYVTPGKGNWAFDLEADGTIEMTVNTNNKTVSYVLK